MRVWHHKHVVNMPTPGTANFLLRSSMDVFLDESGDLGWKFSEPFGDGGSSRFLTLAFLLVDENNRKYPKRFIKKFRNHYGMKTSREIKGSELTQNQHLYFAEKARDLLSKNPEMRVRAITVEKMNVLEHIRSDPNKLYNYMINLCLLDEITSEPIVYLTPDPRSIKVSSGDSMVDYLQTQLWFEKKVSTTLIVRPHESHTSLNLQFVDVISNIVWSHYEKKDSGAYSIIGPSVPCKTLFFR